MKFFQPKQKHGPQQVLKPDRDWVVIVLISIFLFLALAAWSYFFFYSLTQPQPLARSKPSVVFRSKEITRAAANLRAREAAFNELRAAVPNLADPSR